MSDGARRHAFEPFDAAVRTPSVTNIASPVTVLVVEDDSATRRLSVLILERAKYRVVEAGSVAEARLLWDEHRPEIALVDIDLPDEKGSAILDQDWVRRSDTVVIIVTGLDDVDLATDVFARGAYGYVVKPYTMNELLMQISSALRRRQLERTVAGHVRELESKVIDGATGISELRSRLETVASSSTFPDEKIVGLLASAVCLRDDDTGLHIERVSRAAAALAEWSGFSVDPAPAVRLAAAMHDVGKIGIPDWVLHKPGPLTTDETTIIRRHCELGHRLLGGSESPVLRLAASVALNHHERWDGDGYPHGRRGDDIPMAARITSVADVFDALTRDRVYRAALPVDAAVGLMVKEREGLFDPRLLDMFLGRLDDVLEIAG